MQVPTDLRRIVALAYSPKSGNLFVANFPMLRRYRAGIYRIDRVNLGRVQPRARPRRSPTFAQAHSTRLRSDGTLYVTAAGDSKGKNAGGC